MTAAFRRQYPQATFLALALLVNVCASLAARNRASQIGACLDMTVTVTALYYWILVRPGFRPKSGMIFIALLGLLRASLAFPLILPGRIWIGAGLEAGLIAAVVIGIARSRKNSDADPVERIRHVIAGMLPFRGGERALAGELSVLYYAFAWRARPNLPAETRPLTLHKREGFHDLILMVGLGSLLEVVPVHLLIAHWSVATAWIMTCLSLYGAVWALALYRSFALRPGWIGASELSIRFGLLFSLRVPFESIASVSREPVRGAVILPRGATPTLYLTFSQPLRAEKILGFTKKVTAIGIAPDDDLETGVEVEVTARL